MDIAWSFAIDRGGTFTDVIGRATDGRDASLKLLSSSPTYTDAAVEGMRRLLGAGAGAPFPAERVETIRMGATVATTPCWSAPAPCAGAASRSPTFDRGRRDGY